MPKHHGDEQHTTAFAPSLGAKRAKYTLLPEWDQPQAANLVLSIARPTDKCVGNLKRGVKNRA